MPPSPRPLPSLNLPRLYAIVDVEVAAGQGRVPLDVARAFLAAGVTCLQLRAKTWPSGRFLEEATALAGECRRAGARLVINDRADVAAMAQAAGVHVGQEDLAPADARAVVGPGRWVGVSTHSELQVRGACAAPVNYLAIGPVFGTATKATGYDAVGLDAVRMAAGLATAARLPVVAIGGITLERALWVIEAGASSVAVITDLLTGDPEARARAFLQALK